MPAHKSLCLPALLLLVGCAPAGDRAADPRIDTLPNGSFVVHNTAPRWQPGQGWRVVQDLAIGGADSGPADILDVRGITADAAGRIYILDAAALAVQVFDVSGRHLRTIGRKGGGPGEFASPIGLDLLGDHLLVVDQTSMRLTLFDSGGGVVATHPRVAPANNGVGLWQGGVDRGGRLIDQFPQEKEGNPWGEWALIALDSGYRPADTFPQPQFTPRSADLVKKTAVGESRTRMVLPNAPMLDWTFDPAGYIWFGVSDHYAIVQRRLAGDTVRIIERAWTPPPLSDSAAARAQRFVERLQKDGFTISQSDLPTTAPAFQDLVVDDHGNLWVSEPKWLARKWEVFDSTGILLGPVEFPDGVGQLKFVRDHYYAVTRDSDDVVRVVRGTVSKR